MLGIDGLRVRSVLRHIRPRLSRRSSAFGFLATLTVVVGLLFASSPTASGLSVSNTDQILTTTGGGGSIGPVTCQANSVIYGIGAGGNAGATSITQPTAWCALLDATATSRTWNTNIGGSGWGGASDTTLTGQWCADGQALVGLRVHKQANGYVSGWQLICGTLPSGGSRTTSSTVFGWSNESRAAPNGPETIQCPTGMVAVGMVGYVGAILDKIGFRCGTISGADQTTLSISTTSATYGTNLTLSTSGGLGSGAVTYQKVSGNCTVSGSTLTPSASGSCVVTATKASDTNYSSTTSANTTVSIAKASNTISFTDPGTKTWSASTFTVSVSATSGDSPTVTSSTTAVCTVSGTTVTMVASGTCTLTAAEDGNTNYNAATDVSRTFTINKASQTITFAAMSTQTWSSTPISISPSSDSGLSVSVTSSTTGVCTVSGTTVTMVASGTCTLTASQSGDSRYSAASDVSRSFSITSNGSGRTGYTGNGSIGANGTKYVVQQFTATGTATWTVPQGVTSVDYLVVGGGGSGTRGYCNYLWGHGGGGGGVSTGSLSVTGGTAYTVTVGAGGAGAASQSCTNSHTGSVGGTSSLATGGSTVVSASGGGTGYSSPYSYSATQALGGTSGTGNRSGSSFSYAGGNGGGGTNGCGAPGLCGAGGGGGAGGAGSGLTGGIGVTSTLSGTSTMYGSGGGGRNSDGYGSYYAASGTLTTGASRDGAANTGQGGNDTGSGYTAGGSGIVVLRYALPAVAVPDLSAASDSGSITTDNITTTRTLTFTGSAPIGASVQLSYATASSMSDTDSSTGSWSNSGSACTADTTSGAWSCTTAQLDPGIYKFRSTATSAFDGLTDTQTSTTALAVTVDTTAPTVSSLSFTSSAGADNTYKAGDTVSVTVVFSEAVTVTGSPRIALAGLTSKYATYASGSGTTSIVLSYTVASGDTDADGLALTANTLELNSGTIADTAGNSATLTHSAVTAQSAHMVDTTAPTVSNVTSSTANGTISVGGTVSIQVTFTEAVTVTGTPQLTLETGTTDRVINYVSGSGTTSLTFTYTVQSGDSSTDLDYVSTSALALNGGSIADTAGNTATLTLPTPGAAGSLSANKALVITWSPTKVVSARTPVGTASGAAFTTQPQVSLQDSGSNVVTSDNSTVVTASVSAGATLVGTTTATVVNGVATFTNLGISGTSGTSYTITYSASYGGSALTSATQSVTPTVGAATQLSITTQPVGGGAGAALSTQPVVKVLDSGSNVVTTSTASITVTASAGTLGGTTTVTASSGVATFTNLTFAGTTSTNYTLSFASTGLTSATSSNFTVSVGAATQLVLTTSAAGSAYGSAFTTQPVVEIRDAGGNKVTTATNQVTASLSSGTVVGTGNSTAVAGVATFSGLGITATPGSVTVTYSATGLTSATQSITVAKGTNTVTFTDPGTKTWSGSTFVVSVSATSGDTPTVTSSTTSVCTVSGVTVTMVISGTCTLVAAEDGNTNYDAASNVTRTFTINKASQTITFTSPGDQTYSATGVAMSFSASSGLTPTVTSGDTSVCTVSGSTLTLVSSGSCALTATQAGNANYEAATSVTRTITVSKASTTLSGFANVSKTFGDVDFTVTAPTASVAGAITYSSSDATVASVSGTTIDVGNAGTATITATLAPTDSGKYNSTTTTMTITVAKATPTLGTFAAVTKTYGDSAFGFVAPTASVAGSFGYSSSDTSVASVVGSIATVVAPGSTTITASFTPTDSSNYNSASTTMTMTVNKASQTISFTSPGNQTYSASTISLTFSASSGLTPTVTSGDTSVCTVSGSTLTLVSSGSCALTAAQTGNANYSAATSVVNTITISKATPSIGSMSNQTKTYGDASFTPTAPTVTYESASVAGSLAYSSSSSSVASVNSTSGAVTVAGAGSATITASFTPSDTGKFNAASTTYAVSVAKSTQSALTLTSTSGTYGTGLTLTTSGGSSGGSVTYAVADGSATGCAVSSGVLSVTSSGTCSVTATMAASDNYLVVSSSATTVTFAKANQSSLTLTSTTGTYGSATTLAVSGGTTGGAVSYSVTGTGCLISGGALTKSTTGTCSVTATMDGDGNYNAVSSSATTVTFGQRPITVTATATSKQYGASDSTFGYTITSGSLVSGDSLSGSLSRASGEDVGTYAMSVGSLANGNYAITFVSADLTITQRPITVTAAAKTKEYGAADPAFTYSVTTGSLVSGDSLSGSLSRVSGTDVGTYAITIGTLANSNYSITYSGALLTITQRPITVTADDKSKEYGSNDPALSFTVTTGSLVSGDSLTGSMTRASGSSVGSYAISQGTLANANYSITFVTGTLTITQRAITVTADDLTKVYGSTDPSLTWAITTGSLVGSDQLSGLLTRASGSSVGSYAISQGALANANYSITFVGANLTITAKPITVTPAAQTKQYGASDPSFTYTITSGSLETGDSLSGALSRTSGANVGTYAITIGTLANANYNISVASANLTITTRPITLTADDKTITYGDSDPSFTYTITSGSVVGSDTFSGSLTRVSGTNAGTYAISRGTLANSNYAITFVAGTLTINKANQSALTLTTTNVVYGTDTVIASTGGSGDGAVTYSVTSAGTAACSLSGATLSTSGAVGSTCTVTATKAASTNYNQVSSSATTITVGSRAITITATAKTKQYSQADPALTYTITSGALVGSDTLTGSLTRASGESVGTYAISQGTLGNSNYTITYVGANLTVTGRPITVSAVAKTKVYGASDPALTYTITSGSLYGSDTLTGSLSRATGENVGTYSITQGSLGNSNYTITYVDASFDVTGAEQSGFTVSAGSMSVTYGTSTTLSTSGGDGTGDVTYSAENGTGSCSISGSTLTGTGAGTCQVTATKEAQGNYLEATSNTITITITKANQTISFADPADRNFSTSSFTLSPSSTSGLGVTLASSTTSVCTVDGATVTMVFSGTCTLTASRGSSANYNAAINVTQSFDIAAVLPYAPTITQLTASDRAISVLFTVGNSGGSALTNHEYSIDNGVTWTAWPVGSTTSPLNIAGLTNGVEYQVKVRAINGIGTGSESNMLAVTPVAPVVIAGPTTTSVDPTSTTSTVIESTTTTIFTTTTVTLAPNRRQTTTTVARRAITTTTVTRDGETTTTTRATTTTTSTSTTLIDRVPAGLQRLSPSTTIGSVTTRPQSPTSTITSSGVIVRPQTSSSTTQSSTLSSSTTQSTTTQDRVTVRPQSDSTVTTVAPATTTGALAPLAPAVTTIESTTTSVFVAATVPAKLAPANGASVIAGEPATVVWSQVEQVQMKAEVGGSTLTMAAISPAGERQPLLPNGSLAYVPGSTTRVDGSGMLPGSRVEVWMHSTPTLLGVATVGDDGGFAQVFQLPALLEHGAHKLQVVGVSPKGEEMVVALGVTVTDQATIDKVRTGEMSVTEADMLANPGVTGLSTMSDRSANNVLLVLILITLLLVAVSFDRLVVLPRRRRLADRLRDATPWLVHAPAVRIATHGLGFLVGLGALVSTNGEATAPTALWLALLVVLGILDSIGAIVALSTWAGVLLATGKVDSFTELSVVVLVGALTMLPLASAEILRPHGRARSERAGSAAQLVVTASMSSLVTVVLTWLLVAGSDVRFTAADHVREIGVAALLAAVVRFVLVANLNPHSLRHARAVPLAYFAAIFAVVGVTLVSVHITAANVIGIVVVATLIAASLGAFRFVLAPRTLARLALAGVITLTISSGAISFGRGDVQEVVLEQDATAIDSMKIIGETSAFIDGVPHVFVAGSIRPGEVVYVNGAVGMTLTLSSVRTDGTLVPLNANGAIQLMRGHSVSITATGFAPDQDVNAWLFSDPVLVGNTKTNGKGSVRDSFVVPAVVKNGDHTLQIRLMSPDGKVVNFGLPVVVIDETIDTDA